MASHKRFKLPPFKVTHHPQKEATNIYRGNLDADMKALEREQTCSTVQEPSDTLKGSPVNDFPEPYEDTDPTLHELYCKATVSAWEKLRSNILFLATENSAMPLDQGCMVCNSAAGVKDVGQTFTTVFNASVSSMKLPISFMWLKNGR